jgi:hypothetical protein
MVQSLQNFKKQMDESFGSPAQAIKSIKELSDSLAQFDHAKLKDLKALLATMDLERLKTVLEIIKQLRSVDIRSTDMVEVVKMIVNLDIAKVKEFNQVLVNLIALVKLLPKDFKDLPIGEILNQLKQG